MRPSTKKLVTNLSPGTKIKGKWHQQTYQIVKLLGSGTIGSVYLALHNQSYVALKISDQPSAITTEVNVLKAFKKVQGSRLGPSLLDVDDWIITKDQSYSFYVMEYLRGYELNTFIKRKGYEWLGILIVQLLSDLRELHDQGWVFGDLKPENVIVTDAPPRLRLIDVGGTTKQGRAVKEYTEFYDRGYWGLGTRKADPAYDLFAVAMVMIQVFYPNRFDKGPNPYRTLTYKIKQSPILRRYAGCLEKALLGKYTSSSEMSQDLSKIILKRQQSSSQNTKTRSQPRRNNSTVKRQQRKQKHYQWEESLGIAMVTALFTIFYFVIHML
ncbi:serine/threonine protein kinase [Salinibacillus xinjiangensis]|uniref:Protein kinase n=1 Tax=Salinibacillus xinjiangensis TaxID=1229268 RepID=A0A6G1XBD5_9BACI|nr:protein kinase [Salinibacillus xinjiangensis]MRG88190.1 protein kinase [Salinibacillus xinjiangensis]